MKDTSLNNAVVRARDKRSARQLEDKSPSADGYDEKEAPQKPVKHDNGSAADRARAGRVALKGRKKGAQPEEASGGSKGGTASQPSHGRGGYQKLPRGKRTLT